MIMTYVEDGNKSIFLHCGGELISSSIKCVTNITLCQVTSAVVTGASPKSVPKQQDRATVNIRTSFHAVNKCYTVDVLAVNTSL